jgi:uncharacterized protein
MDRHTGRGGLISSLHALETLCGKPGWVAFASDTDRIIPQYRAFIEASPYVAVATNGPDGPDCSPRGDSFGFVQVPDERTVLIPDRAGNNRIETLRNLIHDPRVALHFLVPGREESLRVKGHAAVSDSAELLDLFRANGKPPRTVIIVSVERAYMHCGKAVKRARLWNSSQRPATGLAGLNSITAAIQRRRCFAFLADVERRVRTLARTACKS